MSYEITCDKCGKPLYIEPSKRITQGKGNHRTFQWFHASCTNKHDDRWDKKNWEALFLGVPY